MPNQKIAYQFRSMFTYLKYKLRLPRDKVNMATTIESVRSGATLTGANLWVLVLAIFTASLGLNVNSTAVIIGAMLISPLMGPIVAIGMGVAIHDFGLVYRSLKNFGLAVGLSILTSSLYFFVSPLKVPGSELLARTSPTIYDVLIAIVGGLAGIIAGSGKLRQSNVVPGVAIATALMPPLCTVGFGIANLNPTYIVGAFYLFFINTVFISLSTYFIVRFLKYPAVEMLEGRRSARLKRMIGFIVMMTLLPSIYLTYQIVREYVFEEKAKSFIKKEFEGRNRIVLKTSAEFKKNKPLITVTLLGAEVDSMELAVLKSKLPDYGLGNAKLDINQDITDIIQKGTFSSSVMATQQANAEAISKLYREMDTVKTARLAPLLKDSLQANIGRELAIMMPDLKMLSIQQHAFFDAALKKNRRGWIAEMAFAKRKQAAEIGKLREWLTIKLPGDTILLTVQ
jgi:uncharacterized hydrophobic protein (TIGR00271 family)